MVNEPRKGYAKSTLPECRFERDECHACREGKCMVLMDTDFGENVTVCPFYRSKDDNLRESAMCINRLIRIGRTDLIEKYQPVYRSLNLLGGEEDFERRARAELEDQKQKIREQVVTRLHSIAEIAEEWYE